MSQSTTTGSQPPQATSTRPYLIRALYEWCADNGLTPYVAVRVDDTVRVPREYVKDGEIVLNISMDATSALQIGNEYIEFKARFAGVGRDILVPIRQVMAIYARENGQGMAFPLESAPDEERAEEAGDAQTIAAESSPSHGETPGSGGAAILSLASDSDAADHGDGSDPEPPRPTTPPAGGRPALKRVK
ncbi:peptidase [Hylemonella gracilis str. Niagara R]|uniref:Peptidase n=1 Tax=Hylemonella gracilis str. Niagara R TaxID=1458275 RepID=A0A016XKY7_9BURK|nr:ClpXP protease specificity-enhancing factor [Hylemonella gracilis]EYC52237.1 peptidase [Hylemonella gracilis str. Niagara R]